LFTKIPAHQWKTINHKYLKQNAVDYRSHLIIENKLKVIKGVLFRKQAQLSFPPKKTLGVRVETNIPKNSKAIIMLALCPGRCLLHHKGIANDQIIFPRHSGKCEVCSESVTKFSFNFFTKRDYIAVKHL